MSFRTLRAKKVERRTDSPFPSVNVTLPSKEITDLHGAHLDDNGETHLFVTPTLHSYPASVENHRVPGRPCTHDSCIPRGTRTHSHNRETGCSSLVRLTLERISTANRATVFSRANAQHEKKQRTCTSASANVNMYTTVSWPHKQIAALLYIRYICFRSHLFSLFTDVPTPFRFYP